MIDVPVVPLDELTETADVVKIDVEGAEHLVLAGMSRLLATSRPLVFIEVLPEAEIHECESILRGAGYSFFHLTDSGRSRGPGLSQIRIVDSETTCADPANPGRQVLRGGDP
ncbi:MAG: FkbM family methyltransferase [Microthrixaceae bacterium]|nr:FkbM family methyltransferase [Microthrixaceae bacterium]